MHMTLYYLLLATTIQRSTGMCEVHRHVWGGADAVGSHMHAERRLVAQAYLVSSGG